MVAAARACTTSDGVQTCVGDEDTLQIDLRVDRLIARKVDLLFAKADADHGIVGKDLSGYVSRIPLSTADEAEWFEIFLRTVRESSSAAVQSGVDASDRLRTALAAQHRERARFVESRMRDRLVGYRFLLGLYFSRPRPGSFDATSWAIDQETEIVELLKKGGGARCATLGSANTVDATGGTTR